MEEVIEGVEFTTHSDMEKQVKSVYPDAIGWGYLHLEKQLVVSLPDLDKSKAATLKTLCLKSKAELDAAVKDGNKIT